MRSRRAKQSQFRAGVGSPAFGWAEAIRRGDLSDSAVVTAELARRYVAQSALTSTEPVFKEFAAKVGGLDLNEAT